MDERGRTERLQALSTINVNDMLAAFGIGPLWPGRRWLARLCRPLATGFARQVLAYDALVAEIGLTAAARWLLGQHVRQVLVAGADRVPAQGPVLIVANHPGLTDTAALFASLPRADLRIIAADRPFLRSLPATSRALIYLAEEPTARLALLRSVTRHLRTGGAILTFPGGEIEPDPAVLPGAVGALARWSPSIGVMARLAPDLQLLPAIVSGVLSPAAQQHPLTRLRRAQADRERFGAMLQLIVPRYRAVTVRVAFGAPLPVGARLAAGATAAEITSQAIAAAGELISAPPCDWHPLLDGR